MLDFNRKGINIHVHVRERAMRISGSKLLLAIKVKIVSKLNETFIDAQYLIMNVLCDINLLFMETHMTFVATKCAVF